MKKNPNEPGDAIPSAAADVHFPGQPNTAAIVTYAAAPGACHAISGLAFSYIGAPVTWGLLTIEDGAGVLVFKLALSGSSAGVIPFPIPKKGSVNTALIVTLSAGGNNVFAQLNVLNHWTEVP